MKKIITKFWGVALIVVLLSTLLIAATPVSAADPLMWNAKTDAPNAVPDVGILTPGVTVTDFDFNGGTMLAAAGSTALYLSTMGGTFAANIGARITGLPTGAIFATFNYVAIAPDDANVMVALDSIGTGGSVAAAISVNGGATWTDMGLTTNTNTILQGVAISPVVTGGIRYVATWGRSAANDTPVLYYFAYGSGVGSWVNAANAATWTNEPTFPATNSQNDFMSFAFSPNFASDYIAVAISQDSDNATASSGLMQLHLLSFNSLAWNNTIAAGYPVTVATVATAGTEFDVISADVALPPDYDGSDESLRIAFVGASITETAGESGGIWRILDSTNPVKIYGSATAGQGTAVFSVDYDGATLVGGSYATNNVVRSVDPLGASPTFANARTLKRIGITGATDMVLLKYRGETLYGSKRGTSGAIAKSLDSGNTWNDFTMINAGDGTFLVWNMGTISDIYMTAAGDPWYVAASASGVTSVYRVSMFAAQRVLTLSGTLNLQLRGIASEPDLLYAADLTTGTTLYYSDNGGLTRWQQRNNVPAAMADMAVESDDVIYVGSGVNVYKSVNSGFTWGLPVNTKLGTSNVYGLLSLGENELIATGNLGSLTFSKDGGVTWTATFAAFSGAGGNVRAAATGLDNGDFIFIGGAASNQIYRCEITPANFLYEFRTMNLATTATYGTTGLRLISGVLYASSSNGTASYLNHTLTPTALPTHTQLMWSTAVGPTAAAFTLAPQAIEVSTGPVPNDIYIYNVNTTANSISYFQDNVALNPVIITGPDNESLIQILSPLTGQAQNVNFLWNRLSLSTSYEIQISLDADFNQRLTMTGVPVVSSADPVSYIAGGFNPGNTYYWRVRAVTPVYSAWSETRSFTVQPTAASVPTVSSPTAGAAIDNTRPAFSWSPVAGATMYRFELSTSADFATTVYASDVAGAGVGLPSSVTLQRGTTYFWRVKALTPVESDWSTVANFVVAEEEVVVTPPPATTTVITIPPQPAATTTIVTVPPDVIEEVNPAYIWAIIIIGAVLVIAVIVLIVRTRRSV